MHRIVLRSSKFGRESGRLDVESEITSERKMRVELYSGWWISCETAISNWSHWEK